MFGTITALPRRAAVAAWRKLFGGARQSLGYAGDWLAHFGDMVFRTASGVNVNENTALNYSAVWAATRLISETVALLPLKLHRRLPDGSKADAFDHPIYRLIHDAPNDYMSAFTWRATMTAHLLNWGNAWSEIVRGGGAVLRLNPIHPSNVELDKERPPTGEFFKVRRDNGEVVSIHATGLLHLTGPLSDDGIMGRGVIRQARESIGMGLATEQFGAAFFSSGGRPPGVLTYPEELSKAAKKRMRKSWRQVYGKPGQRKIVVLEEGVTYTPIGIPPEDAQFLETRQHNITEIARWYNLPPHKLAELTHATFSNIEHQEIEFVQSLMPWMARWEQEIWRQLLTPAEQKDLFARHTVAGLLRGDSKARAEFYEIMSRIGVFSPNDILALEEYNGIGEDGDHHFVQMNMIPLDRLGEIEFKSKAGTGEKTPGGANNSDGDLRAEANRELLTDALRRCIHGEAVAARRACKHSSQWLDWLDEYYDRRVGQIATALRPVLHVIAPDKGSTADIMAARHVEQSKRQLLRLYDTETVDNFQSAVEACVNDWEQYRAPLSAESILRHVEKGELCDGDST